MRRNYCVTALIFAVFIGITPNVASAHQPRIVTDAVTNISNPEVSQAFYGELNGAPAEFRVVSDREFRLYVGLLVPDIPGAIKAISADIVRVGDTGDQRIALLNGDTFVWTPFYEEFAGDNYFWGPEFSAPESKRGVALKGKVVPAGTYVITVFNAKDRAKYSLVTGDEEAFPPVEIVNALFTIPRVKAQFFGYPPLTILKSPYGWGYVLVMFALAFAFGFLYRYLLRRFARRTPYARMQNIGTVDRRVRIGLAVALFVWAITTSWSPWLLFFSGFCVFEAIFSWCGFYAALGRNTCPIQ